MDSRSVCCALLTCLGLCSGQNLVLPERLDHAVGDTVIFIPKPVPLPPYRGSNWIFNSDPIVNSINNEVIIQPEYAERASFDINTLSLEIRNLNESDEGIYSLTVNTDAGRFNAKTSLQVFAKITEVNIAGPTEVLIEDRSSFNLTCEGNGNIFNTEWMKDNQKLSAGDSVTFSPDNKTVMINPVRSKDSGDYRCTMSNTVSSRTANYSITVNFGPYNLRIDGPNEVMVGETIVLKCIAESTPKPSYKWTVNESSIEVTTEVLTVEQATFENSGTYTCQASNQITGLAPSSSHIVVIKGLSNDKGGKLTGGATAGIVIGVLLGVIAVAGLIFYFVKSKEKPKTSFSRDKSSGAASQINGEPELHYAAIQHSQSNRKHYGQSTISRAKAPEPGMQNQETPRNVDVNVIYSELRK